MDQRGFDDLTRTIARLGTRRRAIKLLGSAAIVSVVAATGTVSAAVAGAGKDATCRGAGELCQSDLQCCAERCLVDQQGRSRCTCRGRGGQCFVDRGCCSGRCRRSGTCR